MLFMKQKLTLNNRVWRFYKDLIFSSYRNTFDNEENLNNFISKGGWKARKNGRDITAISNYNESVENNILYITISKPKHDWKIWIKTIGVLLTDESPYKIRRKNSDYIFFVNELENGYEVSIDYSLSN